MSLDIISIFIGLAALVWSADKFIEGAAAVANHLHVKPLVIGLVILGFGTSAPEIMVSIFAALDGTPQLALGNALGSNIANIALVLGATAVITHIRVLSSVLKSEFPILIAVTAFTGVLLFNQYLSRLDGVILLALLVATLSWMVYQGRKQKHDSFAEEIEKEIPHLSIKQASLWTIVGLVILVASSKLLVWGAVNIAQSLGVSNLVIGLTIVAIGTSLPELAASIMAAVKNEHDMAVGNIIGSNLFNLLAVIGISGIIRPYAVSTDALYRDFTLMAGLTLLLYGFAAVGKRQISRLHGVILLSIFVSYLTLLYLQNI